MECTSDLNPVISLLEGKLPYKLPSKRGKYDLAGTPRRLNILPIATKLREVDALIALAAAIEFDEFRPALCGVFHDADNQKYVVTNGHYLFCFPAYGLKTSQIIRPSDGWVIDEKYPAYQSIIPFNELVLEIKSPSTLINKLAGLSRANKFINTPIAAEIIYDDKSICVSPAYLLTAIKTMRESGSILLQLELPDRPDRAILVRDKVNPEKLAIVMPVMAGVNVDDPNEPGIFTSTVINSKTTTHPLEILLAHYTEKLEKLRSVDSWDIAYHTKSLAEAKDKFSVKYHTEKLALAQIEKLADIQAAEEKLNAIKTQINNS